MYLIKSGINLFYVWTGVSTCKIEFRNIIFIFIIFSDHIVLVFKLYQTIFNHNITDPSALQVCEQIDTCSEAVKSQADKCSKTLAPLYAGQPVATYDTLWKLWVPATVIHIFPWSSYLVLTSNGSRYCHMQRHLCECSVKAADTVPSCTTATPQALSSHHFLVAQPASPTPAACMQPTSAARATPATQMKQAPAVPATPAVQKNALAPKSVTSHATPVQPQRSGHARMAPRCLIQEI